MWFRSFQLELHVDPGTNFYIVALQLGIGIFRVHARTCVCVCTHTSESTVKNVVVWALPLNVPESGFLEVEPEQDRHFEKAS